MFNIYTYIYPWLIMSGSIKLIFLEVKRFSEAQFMR